MGKVILPLEPLGVRKERERNHQDGSCSTLWLPLEVSFRWQRGNLLGRL